MKAFARLLSILIFLGCPLAKANDCYAPGPDAYWPMDQTTDDVINNYDAQLFTSFVYSDSDVVRGTGALRLSSRGVQYSNGIFLNSAKNALSLSMFIKPDNLNGIQELFDEGGRVHGFALRINDGFLEGKVLARRTEGPQMLSVEFPDDNGWHHVAMTYDNGRVALYIDGILEASATSSLGELPFHSSLGGIGQRFYGDAFRESVSGAFYQGLIDEVSYYERALTATEVSTISGCQSSLPIEQTYSASTIMAGESTRLRLTLTNTESYDITGIDITLAMPAALWLDDTELSGDCPEFTLSGQAGNPRFRLNTGRVNANSTCSLDITVRTDVNGQYSVAIDGFNSDQAGTAEFTGTPLNVMRPRSAICTPGNGASGAIFMNYEDDIYSLNLQTAKATLVTTSPLVSSLNSLAINADNYLIYYVDQSRSNSLVYYYDLINDSHGLVSQESQGIFNGLLGSYGLSWGGASFANGSLYLGIRWRTPQEGSIVRAVFSEDGRTLRYANQVLTFPDYEYGDLVVSGSKLFLFTRFNSPRVKRYSLVTRDLEFDVSAPQAVQGGAQRDGNTIWNVGTHLGLTDTNTGSIQVYRNITVDGINSVGGTAYDAAGCVPVTSSIGNQIWFDTNGNGIKDADEQGIGNVTIDLYYDINNDGKLDVADDVAPFTGKDGVIDRQDRVQQVVSDANGHYRFSSLTADAYLVVISDENGVLQGARPTFNSSDPDRDIKAVNLGVLDTVDDLDFGYKRFIDIRGQVINDHGAQVAANAHNTLLDNGESGMAGVVIRVVDTETGTELCRDITTDSGNFQCLLDNNLTDTAIMLTQEISSQYLITNENIGNTGAGNNNTLDGRLLFNTGSTDLFEGIVFSIVKENALSASQQSTISKNAVVDYAHVFTANSAGEVIFELTSLIQPDALWSETLYRDVNCNTVLDVDESQPFTGGAQVKYGDSICLIARIRSPSNVSIGAKHRLTLQADFHYQSTTKQATIAVTDQSYIASSQLRLMKTVTNLTQGGVSDIDSEARPGDVLRYDIRFINNTETPISQLRINDAIPAFTFAVDRIECPQGQPLAPSLTGCSVLQPALNNQEGYQGPIVWQFDGELGQGEQGSLSFEVELE